MANDIYEALRTEDQLFNTPPTADELGGTPPPVSQEREPSTQQKTAAQINAELRQMLEAGQDPRKIYRAEEGFLGPKDVFSYETEKGFSPEVRAFVRQHFGPAEMQYDPDAGTISNLWTKMFGSAPTDEEKKQIAQAQVLAERGSGFPSAKYKRMMAEIYGGAPSPAEIRGDIPKGIDLPPWLQEKAKVGRKVELPKFQAEVLLRDYGTVQGSKQDQETITRSRVAANWLNQLESISPGLASNTIGPILAEDFNVHYGLKGTDDEVTAEKLNIRQIDWQGTNKLVYTHPETGKPTLFDPVKLELRDIAEVLPELMVLGGDVLGMIGGTVVGGAAGPKTALGGNVVGGALGAMYGRLISYKMALSKNNFAFDERFNGWVKKGFVDEQNNPKVITEKDLYLGAFPDALWSIGGNIGARGIVKLGKLALFGPQTGKESLQGSLTVDEFVDAVDHFKTTRMGQRSYGPWAQEGATPPPTSVAFQKAGEDLLEESRLGGLSQADAQRMRQLAHKYLQQAEVLRYSEAGTPAAAARSELREDIIQEAQGEAAVTPEGMITTSAEDVAVAVEKGLPVVATKEFTEAAQQLNARNEASLKEIDEILSGGEPTSATELGAILAKTSKAIMGDVSGDTGIYGVYNNVAKALRQRIGGIPLKPFDISSVTKEINKLQKSAGGIGGGFRDDFLKEWNSLVGYGEKVGRLTTKTGRAQGTINLDYTQMKDLIISLRNAMGNSKLTQPQLRNMSTILGKLEDIQIRGLQIIDDAGATAGKPTQYAKIIGSADTHFSNLAEIWQRGLTKGLEEGTYYKIADKLFEKGAAPEFVGKIMSTIKPGKNQLELMRNTLLYRYKLAMEGIARGELVAGRDIAGQRVRIGIQRAADDALVVREASQTAQEQFERQNKSWIETLFKDDEFYRLGQKVTEVGGQAIDLKKLAAFDETLRSSNVFGPGILNINRDLSKVIIESPQLLMDEIFKLKPGPRAVAFRELYKAFTGLPKLERELAEENVRNLAFRRLMNPDQLIAATRDEAFDAYTRSNLAAAELKTNSSIYDEVFGETHRKNLEKIFRDIGTLSRTESAPALEGMMSPSMMSKIPLAALKIYVGVLNRRARTLTQAQKIQGNYLQGRFREALLDPDKAAKFVRSLNVNAKTKYGLNFIGQLLGIEIGEAIDAVQTFGIDPNRFPGVPESDIRMEALQSFAGGGLKTSSIKPEERLVRRGGSGIGHLLGIAG
jgi:hypothetical protein